VSLVGSYFKYDPLQQTTAESLPSTDFGCFTTAGVFNPQLFAWLEPALRFPAVARQLDGGNFVGKRFASGEVRGW